MFALIIAVFKNGQCGINFEVFSSTVTTTTVKLAVSGFFFVLNVIVKTFFRLTL